MDKSFYILTARLQNPISIPNFFADQGNPAYDLLVNPPYLRKYGWNLITLDTPRIIKGECWEVKNGDRKVLRLYKDGSIVTRFAADGSFLGWGRTDNAETSNIPESVPVINALALLEVTYEFVSFYAMFLEKINVGINPCINVKLSNMAVGQSRLFRVSVTPGDAIWDLKNKSHVARENSFEKELWSSTSELNSEGRLSFRIVEEIFNWFGIPSNNIPYNINNTIDADKIKNIR